MFQDMTLVIESPPRNTTNIITRIWRTVKSVLGDKKKVEQQPKDLATGTTVSIRLNPKSSKSHCVADSKFKKSTGKTTQLQQVEAAAALFQCKDVERMASARNVIERYYCGELLHQPDTTKLKPISEYRLFQKEDPLRIASARISLSK